ncbi:MAG TPA: AsmA-like C-terminal region-containing protein, partial [Candidatus Polarisedimenticolia bacterium]|nr:AsmA-like C-terminal region-containing protein [Candidatus Polarisedimenticolia bacterium]
LDVALDLSLGEGGKRVAFRKLEASTGKTRLSASGSLLLREKSARIDVTVRPSRVMAGDIATVAAVLGAKFPAGLTSSAPITFSGSASGPLDQPERMRFQGEIALSGARYADPTLGRPVEDVAGKLTFENGALQVSGFTARVNQTKVAGRLEVRDFQSPRVTLALSSSRANLDDLLALLTPSTPSAATASSSFAGGDDILARTRGAGTIRIDEGSFGTFRFSRFDGDLHLEGKVVTFDPVSFRLYGGTYRGALSADLRRAEPRYSYRSNLSAVNAQEFLGENLGIKDLLAGTVSADLTLDGGGSSLDRILNSLNGRGSIKVDKGWIGELNVLKGLAKASDLLGETTLAKVSREVSSARTDFSSLTGDLEIAGGRVTTRNLKALTKDLDLDGKGSFTLAGNLDLDLNVLFSRDLTQTMLQEGSRARYLDQRDGRIVLPLTIKGPLAAPAYGVDLRSIARSAARSGAVDRLAKSGSPLGELAAGLLGRKPGREAPPHANDGRPLAPAPNNKAPAGESPVAPGAGDSSIRISSHEYGGNFLLPDLTIRGEFSGVGLASADLKVDGKGGQTVVEKADAFAEIAAYYAAHDRAAPARIPFRTKLDGKALAGAGDLRITITLHRSDGTSSVQTFTQKKRGL